MPKNFNPDVIGGLVWHPRHHMKMNMRMIGSFGKLRYVGLKAAGLPLERLRNLGQQDAVKGAVPLSRRARSSQLSPGFMAFLPA